MCIVVWFEIYKQLIFTKTFMGLCIYTFQYRFMSISACIWIMFYSALNLSINFFSFI